METSQCTTNDGGELTADKSDPLALEDWQRAIFESGTLEAVETDEDNGKSIFTISIPTAKSVGDSNAEA